MIQVLSLLLVGCAPEVLVDIASPTGDAPYVQGVPVALQADVTADGVAVGPAVSWSADGWAFTGNYEDVTDLPLGTYTLTATAAWEGGEGSASVDVEVVEPPPEPVAYTGAMNANADISSPLYTGTVACTPQSLDLVVDPDGTLSGVGVCDAYGERRTVFDGLVSGASMSGTMYLDGQPDQRLEFSGTAGDGHLAGSFDGTFTQGQGTMRFYGDFEADAQ